MPRKFVVSTANVLVTVVSCQVVKQLWEYIKEKDLQDPENRKRIRCDDALKGLFGTDSTDMFKMNKLLSKHIWPLEVTKTAESTVPFARHASLDQMITFLHFS